MRRLHDAATSWKELQRYKSLDELRKTVRIGIDDLRSAYWKAFLLFQTVDISTWIQTLSSSRSAYDSLRVHFLSSKEASDPLSEVISELSVADESLRAEISQDVSRCMPENLYFRQPETQQMLTEILFVFAKLNPDVSYRQGMHELLAPVLWVVERDAIDLGLSSKLLGEDAVIKAMFDADYIEHDSFALFSQLMHSAKNFYEQTTSSGNENPMVIRSKRIVFTFLPQIDPELAFHLKKIDIAPQVFLMRWIRLLFGREFPFDDVLSMWDIIFAEDPSLEIVDHVCLVMLLRVRWELLECDYNSALALLLRYPEPVRNQAQGICIDAVYLRENMHPEAGGYLVLKYTDKPLRLANRPNTPPALQRNITMFSGSVVSTRKGRNLEAFAKDIYERGGKAVRNAVEEVNKKAQEIRDSAPLTLQGPEAVLANRRSGGRGAIAPQSQVAARIKALERRNKQLSKLLEGALNELWDFEKNDHSEDRAKLSMAIAKVQFVHVHLNDSELDVDDHASDEVSALGGASSSLKDTMSSPRSARLGLLPSPVKSLPSPSPSQDDGLADPSTFDDFDSPDNGPPAALSVKKNADKKADDGRSMNTQNHDSAAVGKTSDPEQGQRPIPTDGASENKAEGNSQARKLALEESPFSWMLEKSSSPKAKTGKLFEGS